MLKIPKLDKSIKKLFEEKFAVNAKAVTDAAQKCIDKGGTVTEIKECLKKAVASLSPVDQAEALVILYNFVIVG